MMKKHNQSVKINHNPDYSYIPYMTYSLYDHPYRVLIISGFRWGKTNALLNSIKHQWSDADEIYLHVKDPFELKYQLFINGREKVYQPAYH